MQTKLLVLAFFVFIGVRGDFLVSTRQIRVGVYKTTIQFAERPEKLLEQINIANLYNFTAKFITDADMTNGLATIDVLFVSHSGSDQDVGQMPPATATAIKNWVSNGGGLVTGALMPSQMTNATVAAILQPVVNVQLKTNYGYCMPSKFPSLTTINTNHPVMNSFPGQISFGTFVEWSLNGKSADTETLATIDCPESSLSASEKAQGIVAGKFGAGRTVHLALTYAGIIYYISDNVRFSYGDLLLKNSLFWASAVPTLCPPNYCLNGGRCVGNYTCACVDNWKGQRCQLATCAGGCQNSGNCNAPNVCTCVNGYTGTNCQNFTCDPPCQRNGQCISPNKCNCTTGNTGQDCSSTDCSGVTCQHNGLCAAGATCDCAGTGWSGSTCQTPVCNTPCKFGGTCMRPELCNCTGTSHQGPQCAQPVCDPKCVRGSCVDVNVCDCSGTGYEGPTCDKPICSQSCQNGGSCFTPEKCACSLGWSDDFCTTPLCINECQNGGNCQAPFNCSCPLPWIGNFCQTFPVNGSLSNYTYYRPTEKASTIVNTNLPSYMTKDAYGQNTKQTSLFPLPDGNGIHQNTLGLILGVGLGFCACCVCGMCFAKRSADKKMKRMKSQQIMMSIPVPITTEYRASVDEAELGEMRQ